MKTKGFPNVTKPEDEVKCEASDEFALTNYAKKEEKKGKRQVEQKDTEQSIHCFSWGHGEKPEQERGREKMYNWSRN